MNDCPQYNGPTTRATRIIEFAMLFEQWQAGKVVVLDNSGITVDSEKWKPVSLARSSNITQRASKFRLQDGKWALSFDKKESQFKDSVGLRYVHLLLPGKPISPSQLIYLVNCPGSGRNANKAKVHEFEEGGCLEGMSILTETGGTRVTKESHKIVRAELPGLKEELELLIDAGHHEKAEALEEEIQRIEEHLKKQKFKGLGRPYSTQYKRDLDSVRIAINRAIKSVGTVNPTLAWHLTSAIKFGAECEYRPEKPVLWNL
jgi:hypothetical protein